jgi:hypothetical protein
MEDSGRSEEKKCCAVSSKQNPTKNLFLFVFFLIWPKSTPINQQFEGCGLYKK